MAKTGLIVDDAAFMRMMLRSIFEKNGYEVAGEATNGTEAVEMYESLKPTFVTLDITMPEMDGIEALTQIMGSDASAMVIMCSAIGQQANVLEAIKLGAKDFIVKPFQPERVVESLGKVVGTA